MMVQQNKWRATRFGADARLVDSDTYQQHSVQQVINHLVELLRPQAEALGCSAELEHARELPKQTGARQQLAIYQDSQDGAEVVKKMLVKNDWRSLPKL
jgi:carboxylate-amine ligase